MLEVKQHLSHLLIRQFIAGFHSAQGLVPTIQEHQSSPVSINNVSGQRLALMVISEYVKESFFKVGLRYPGYIIISRNMKIGVSLMHEIEGELKSWEG